MKTCSPKYDKFLQLENDLKNLDEEISNLTTELGSPPRKIQNSKNQNSILPKKSTKNQNKTPQKTKQAQGKSSYQVYKPKTPNFLEKTEIYDDTFSTFSDVFPNENKAKTPKNCKIIENYTPISERINEGIKKKQEFHRQAKEKEEKMMKEQCTFTPTKFSNSSQNPNLNWTPRSQHTIYEKEREKEEINLNSKKINKKSEDIVQNLERQDSFYTRQNESMRKKKITNYISPILKNSKNQNQKDENKSQKTPETNSKKTISQSDLRELNMRLMRPRDRTKIYAEAENEINPGKKVTVVDEMHINQLYESSLTKKRKEPEKLTEESIPKSKKVTPQKAHEIGEKMYQHSLFAHNETRQKAKEMKQFLEEQEMKECTFRPVINKMSPINISQNYANSIYSDVKGTDDFYQRMYLAKLKREKEHESMFIDEISYNDVSVTRSPLKYYSPPKSHSKKKQKEIDTNSSEVDSLLEEIDSSFVFDPSV